MLRIGRNKQLSYITMPRKWHLWACGRAMVGTDAGDIACLVDDGETGSRVPGEDEAALSNRFASLLVDRDLCRRIGDAGRAFSAFLRGLDRFRPKILRPTALKVENSMTGMDRQRSPRTHRVVGSITYFER